MLRHLRPRYAQTFSARNFSQHLKAFATVDPNVMGKDYKGFNLVKGSWTGTESYTDLLDPLTGKVMMQTPATNEDEIQPFIDSLKAVPKSGLHNPFKNKERYLMLSEVNRKVVEVMHNKEVFDFFVKSIQRCVPKSTK